MTRPRGSDGSWDPGDPHGLRVFRAALFWIAGVMAVWATARVFMLGGGYWAYYGVAVLFAVTGLLAEPVLDRLRRPREPF